MQVMSLLVVPMLLEYEMAGDFSFKDRLCTAIKRNLVFYAIALTLFLAFLGYLIVQKELNGENLVNFVIALTNAWGIFLIIFLNGFGLVSIPRKIFNYSNINLRLKKLEYSAAQLSEEKDEFEETLRECSGRLRAIKGRLAIEDNEDISQKVAIMWETLSETDEIFKTVEPNREHLEYAKGVKNGKLTSLNQKLKKSSHEYKRAQNKMNDMFQEWESIKKQINGLDDIRELNTTNRASLYASCALKIFGVILLLSHYA
eukprot:CAMPEP_0170528058 /NCGR_PEP_ID=MMETSP0209-20121228/13556_1 /TAXON_ID=665100 ORGANISM="Litonotus pictus, Strain P1" /NCGR_SAMPLE_ID=MMETSP0209 /ASSEMBLY_ACC=CAM_ASM_000301 /LENGTH=257 /DNA_ID=CAMNT_0010819033 /DNA_START=20 /DNA_END=794 /DNA_ORIENTATION=+